MSQPTIGDMTIIWKETYATKKVEQLVPDVLFISIGHKLRLRAKESQPAAILIAYGIWARGYMFSAQKMILWLLEPARYVCKQLAQTLEVDIFSIIVNGGAFLLVIATCLYPAKLMGSLCFCEKLSFHLFCHSTKTNKTAQKHVEYHCRRESTVSYCTKFDQNFGLGPSLGSLDKTFYFQGQLSLKMVEGQKFGQI